MKISVCIGTYNRANLLAKLLKSVRDADFPLDQTEVLVVDNNSTDSTREIAELARPWFPRFRYLFEKSQGSSYARNTGIHASSGEIICFLDDDTTIDSNYFTAVSRTFSRFNCTGVGGRILPEWNCPKPEEFAIDGPYNVADGLLVHFDQGDLEEELRRSWFGAGMSIRRSALEKHGLFAEHLSRKGRTEGMGEDSEMFLRLKKGGESLFYAPEAIVFHPVDAERISMAFVKQWHFQRGKSLGMIDMQSYRSVHKIPLWTIRKSLNHALQSVSIGGTWKRAYHKAQLWESLGEMRGYYERS
jgi:glycosyltransferase involved in cell wall biosynthesis